MKIMRKAAGYIGIIVSIYVLPNFWRVYMDEYVEQGIFAFRVVISPVLIACLLAASLYLLGLFAKQEHPLSLLPTALLGWIGVFVTDTPVYGIHQSWRGSCIIPAALVLLIYYTAEILRGCVKREYSFSWKEMLKATAMLVFAALPIIEYSLGQWLLSSKMVTTMKSQAWIVSGTYWMSHILYFAGAFAFIPYIRRSKNLADGILLLLIGVSGPALQYASIYFMWYDHVLYAGVSETVVLSVFYMLAVIGGRKLLCGTEMLDKRLKKG